MVCLCTYHLGTWTNKTCKFVEWKSCKGLTRCCNDCCACRANTGRVPVKGNLKTDSISQPRPSRAASTLTLVSAHVLDPYLDVRIAALNNLSLIFVLRTSGTRDFHPSQSKRILRA